MGRTIGTMHLRRSIFIEASPDRTSGSGDT
jgi:hypothetical protein